MTTKHIYIVDDDVSMADALQLSLEIEGYKPIVFTSGINFLEHIRKLRDEIYTEGTVILDINMPILDGLKVHEEIIKLGCTFSIIFLTGHGDVPMAVNSIKNGAFDFLQKPVKRDELNKVLHDSLEHSKNLSYNTMYRHKVSQLTDKEKQVLTRVINGMKNKIIADELNLSIRSIEVYRSKIFKKLDVSTLAELVATATKLNLENIL